MLWFNAASDQHPFHSLASRLGAGLQRSTGELPVRIGHPVFEGYTGSRLFLPHFRN
jgi:hypothetical protein